MKGGQGKVASDPVGLTSGNVERLEEYAIEPYRKRHKCSNPGRSSQANLYYAYDAVLKKRI